MTSLATAAFLPVSLPVEVWFVAEFQKTGGLNLYGLIYMAYLNRGFR
jgi:hypothetical protein